MVKAIAEIEIINEKTGQIRKYTEENKLSPLLNNIFQDALLNASCERNNEIKEYFKNIALLKTEGELRSEIIEDDTKIIYMGAGEVTDYEDDEYTGYQYTYNIGTEDAIGSINCISLVPSGAVDFTKNSTYNTMSNLYSGQAAFNVADYTDKIIKMDIDNNKIYTISSIIIAYGSDNTVRIKLTEYNYDFYCMPLFPGTNSIQMELVDTIFIDISNLFSNVVSPFENCSFQYSVDDKNNRLIILYRNASAEYKNMFNTLVVNLDNFTNYEMHQMLLPDEITLKSIFDTATVTNTPSEISNHDGRLCFLGEYDGDAACIGIDYLDSTNYKIYETEFIEEIEAESNNEQLHNYNDNTLISNHLIIKNEKAYFWNNETIAHNHGFYYKSKIITPNNKKFDFTMAPFVLSTINHLNNTIIKTSAEKLKIKYKILEKKEAN
jgi:hypothetical protein